MLTLMHRPTYTPVSKFKTHINVANTILYFNQEKKKMTQFYSLAVALIAIFSLASSDINCVTAKGVTVLISHIVKIRLLRKLFLLLYPIRSRDLGSSWIYPPKLEQRHARLICSLYDICTTWLTVLFWAKTVLGFYSKDFLPIFLWDEFSSILQNGGGTPIAVSIFWLLQFECTRKLAFVTYSQLLYLFKSFNW